MNEKERVKNLLETIRNAKRHFKDGPERTGRETMLRVLDAEENRLRKEITRLEREV